ncbi:flavodoxin domain-containing protein [Aliiglaciecola sp. CAU 1673]|uniref:flavodoxin domain-containing protein n=1 Tax=Aliiglaciecola sp. CAU 1673 TaxID=3032595 RepID=UPI0023DC4F7B|nr:flavodoxin domain-containing protein [Aliiglaciecola sp. CAU 1673]MDF2179722.1 flavodoxin domain-containing protein [Aliiglaciecola sp. CAU 1673]
MPTFEIIVGSVLGATEYVADALQSSLNKASYESRIHLQPDLTELSRDAVWIICSSTHGAGDLPDNIQAFADQLQSAKLDAQPFLLFGLGDSSYDTFCEGGKSLYELMNKAGATALLPGFYIDVLEHPIPEEEAVRWFEEVFLSNQALQAV